MTNEKYCKSCKRKVTPKGWNPGVLIGIAVLAPMVIPLAGLVVSIFCVYFLVKGNGCPI